ncbi:MAG: hypothetical protein B7Y12_02075 [Rhizobiales bacterium 24-66-13]|nr:MAG: hypothetical protein B7Y61_01105 [Rhizobiales bacterium 35-66-30]OYZ82803.1 MAG: hypothetical protein B7Y12_02075 [Rhizobiales bacterium 24-66-13]OZB11836.1 MAG: hypothetical protein B7X67_02055 [Rhizobiales bacterium 39-66-18]HQS09492.1 hypothetical protein [Xanthobacteraceae bacterium]HQS45941.1 hypothetical protein [Xanthobacteraceae bacterium]
MSDERVDFSRIALDAQIELRDQILQLIQDRRFVGSVRSSEMHAAVACMGAAAVMIALLPTAVRGRLVEQMADALPIIVAKRAGEIVSGEFDEQMARSAARRRQ